MQENVILEGPVGQKEKHPTENQHKDGQRRRFEMKEDHTGNKS